MVTPIYLVAQLFSEFIFYFFLVGEVELRQKDAYVALFGRLLRFDMKKEFLDLLSYMEDKKVQKNAPIYVILFKYFTSVGDVPRLRRLLDQKEKANLTIPGEVRGAALKIIETSFHNAKSLFTKATASKDPNAILGAIEAFTTNGHTIPVDILNEALRSIASQRAFEVLAKAGRQILDLRLSRVDNTSLSFIALGYVGIGSIDEVQSLISTMKTRNIFPDETLSQIFAKLQLTF